MYLRNPIAVIALACALTLMAGCTANNSSSSSSSNSQTSTANLSDAEMKYGASVTRSDKVVYQDDVVIVDHGADAIHSLSPDGLTWTIDANAPHAQELVPGKVMFLTSRAVGRILGTQRKGNDLAVTIGPVEITDVLKEATLSANQPIDLSSMIAYTAPDLPGTIFTPPTTSPQADLLAPPTSLAQSTKTWTTSDVSGMNGTEVASVSLIQTDAIDAIAPALAQPPLGPPSSINVSDFGVTPFCCGGIGIRVVHNSNGLLLKAEAVVYLRAPSVHFDLEIHGGTIRTAEVTLNGVAGLLMRFQAGSETGLAGNLSKEFTVPMDLSLPITGLPVPFAVTLHQTFLVKTAFSSKNSTLNALGHYEFTGSFFMGYHNGSWGVGAPMSFRIVNSLADSISGISLGATGFVMGYQAKVIVGIGAFGFATGPYLGYGVGIGIVNGAGAAALAGPPCHAADIDVDLHVGVGYSIPQPVTSAINFILRALNFKQIKSFGGLEHKERLINKHSATPQGCA
jgi:hypothetical protein